MLSRIKYILLLFFLLLGSYLIVNCTTKYVQRPPTLGSIFVQSAPDGASIFLDNDSTGKSTPDTLFGVPTGMHQISVSKSGYVPSPSSRVVDVLENQTTVTSFDLFDANYGFLYVSSTPESSRIIIDNSFEGESTPHLFANDVPVGTHIVSVSKDGHSTDLPSKYVVNITTSDTVQLDFGLTPAEEGISPGKLAWDFDLLDDFNNRIVLSNYRGFVVVLNLWSYHCPNCTLELPYLQEIYEDYQADSVLVLGINYEDDLYFIRDWRETHDLTLTLLVGAGDGVIVDKYWRPSGSGTPKTMILDRTGIVYYYKLGFNSSIDPTTFRNRLDELLGK